jgi:hypothetical protein
LPIDAIQEFNTAQNAPAEYGWRDGSIVNVGVKSGTNALHGTAYAFGRDAAATDARDFFSGTKSAIVREQFGATAGGPVFKDKLFWFAGAEFIRQTDHSTSPINIPFDVSVGDPTKSMVDACTGIKAAGGTINALSAYIAGVNPTNCAVTPSSSVFHYADSLASCLPGTAACSINSGTTNISPQNNGLAKLDWNITDRHHLNGFFILAKAAGSNTGAVQPYWGTFSTGTVYEYSGAWTWTANSAWLNDFRFGTANGFGSELSGDFNKLAGDAPPAGYGINTGVTQYGGFPCLTITNFTGLGNCGKFGKRGPQGQLNFRDSASYLAGKHAFKFGGEMVFTTFDNASIANVQGSISFDNLSDFLRQTAVPSTTTFSSTGGQNITGGDTTYKLRERWYSAFIGDTWRITPRVTLTPGLRYEYMEAPHEVQNRLGGFDPTLPGGIGLVGSGEAIPRLFKAQKANFLPRAGVAWDMFGNGKTVLRAGIGLMSSFPSITSFAGVAQPVPFGSKLFNGAALVFDPELTHPGIGQASPFTVAFTDPNNQLTWTLAGPVFPGLSGKGAAPCSTASPCQTGATDPNFKYSKSVQWNVDVQRALTNKLTLDVAYVGNHGYDEVLSRDLNAVPVGTGWTATKLAQCAGQSLANASSSVKAVSDAFKAACSPDATVIRNARPYNATLPWFNYIIGPSYGGWSNYNGLQVTLDGRNYHGVSFISGYTFAHALDTWSRSSQAAPVAVDPNNYGYQYGNGDSDIRHRFKFSPTWRIPGVKSPAQMLEGWELSSILSINGGWAWGPTDRTKNDWAGNGENSNANPTPNNGVWQTWNYSGPKSAFNSNAKSGNTLPCYGKLPGCTPFLTSTGAANSSVPADVLTACTTAAQAPYQGNATYMALALRSMYNNACYIRDGGVMTPPAYGTLGNSGRNPFRGPTSSNMDVTVSKNWHVKERYSAQLRVEVFNVFNTPSFAIPSSDPTTGFNGRFGFTNSTAGDPRRMQFGLKLGF